MKRLNPFSRDEILDHLRIAIENAPLQLPVDPPDDLSGWRHPDLDVTICAHCAGRIMARGCHLHGCNRPVHDEPVTCDLCIDREADYRRILTDAVDLINAECEIRSALKQAASDHGIPWGDAMEHFVNWAEIKLGVED